MAAPSLQDLCVDGETFAGEAESEEVLLEWLAHIDSIIEKSLEAGGCLAFFSPSVID